MNYRGDLTMSSDMSQGEYSFLPGVEGSSTDELLETTMIAVNLVQRLRRRMSAAGRASQVDGELSRAWQRVLQDRRQLLEERGRRLRPDRERGRARVVVVSRGGRNGDVLRIEAVCLPWPNGFEDHLKEGKSTRKTFINHFPCEIEHPLHLRWLS